MTLLELIQSVKDKSLSQEQLEEYGDQMSSLFAQMQIEMADLEKEEAMYLSVTHTNEKDSVALRKIMWKATEKGQRLIVVKRYSIATNEMIKSLKNRTFRLIR